MKATRSSRFDLLVAGMLLLCPGPVLTAQDSRAVPSAFTAAMGLLDRGDSSAAIAGLREVTRAQPRFGPAFLELGALLSARASELQGNYETRIAAREALARAAELMPNDPMVLLEYGLLLRRQQMRVDGLRVLERAERAAERRAIRLPPPEAAQLHLALGRIYETWWEDFEQMILYPDAFVVELGCRNVRWLEGDTQAALATAAVHCPKRWNAAVRLHAVPLEELRSQDHASMIEHYRQALTAQPEDMDAATRLLGFIADDGAWEEYDAMIRRLRSARPGDPRVHLFAGLGLHARGRDAQADSAFREAMALLSPAERRAFNDIAPILAPAAQGRYAALDSVGRDRVTRAFFIAQDPMFLSGTEERRLEHYARLAWAELKFGDPVSGNRGWNTDRGDILIRYGHPRKILQCCFASGEGRAVFWSYGPDGPVFVFSRQLTYRRSRFTEDAEALADFLKARAPQQYQPVAITTVAGVPHQVAMFRAAAPEQTRAEIYAAFPVDSLQLGPGDSANAGVFLFDRAYHPLASRVHQLSPWSSGEANYSFDLRPGTYRYGLEARAPGPETAPRPLARVRDTMVVSGFPPGALGVSDLLLADSVSARVPNPTRRGDVFVLPSRTLEFGRTDRVHVYFEVYNLATDPDSLRRYRVELAVEDSTHRDLASRAWRGLTELVNRRDRPAVVEWERTTPAVGDRAVDYFTLAAPPFESGVYSIRVRVTDEVTGATAESRRLFRVP